MNEYICQIVKVIFWEIVNHLDLVNENVSKNMKNVVTFLVFLQIFENIKKLKITMLIHKNIGKRRSSGIVAPD